MPASDLQVSDEAPDIAPYAPDEPPPEPPAPSDDEQDESVIRGLQRVSKPGLRHYASKGGVPRVLRGMGIAIVSTSRGIMTDREARRAGVGGEVICKIW